MPFTLNHIRGSCHQLGLYVMQKHLLCLLALADCLTRRLLQLTCCTGDIPVGAVLWATLSLLTAITITLLYAF